MVDFNFSIFSQKLAADAARETLALVILGGRGYHEAQIVLADERGYPREDGIPDFSFRLVHRSPRRWTVDPLLERSRS